VGSSTIDVSQKAEKSIPGFFFKAWFQTVAEFLTGRFMFKPCLAFSHSLTDNKIDTKSISTNAQVCDHPLEIMDEVHQWNDYY